MFLVLVLTFESHAHSKALLEAAERTTLSLCLIDFTLLALCAGVALIVLYCPLKEALQTQISMSYKNLNTLYQQDTDT